MGTRDPRAEPVTDPPKAQVEGEPEARPEEVILVAAPVTAVTAEAPEAAEAAAATGKPRVVTSTDPRLESIEPFVKNGDWAGIIKELGPAEKAGSLPPHLGLLFALAVNESNAAGDAFDPAQLAIRCAAGLFGVPPESAIALVVGKRRLRKNPLSFGKRPAPPARVSFLIVLITLVVGAGVGWLVTGGGSLRSLLR